MPRATATFNGKTIADAEKWEYVEGNIYVCLPMNQREDRTLTKSQFPPSSVDQSVFTPATLTTDCPWKGTASYYDITVDGTIKSTNARKENR